MRMRSRRSIGDSSTPPRMHRNYGMILESVGKPWLAWLCHWPMGSHPNPPSALPLDGEDPALNAQGRSRHDSSKPVLVNREQDLQDGSRLSRWHLVAESTSV
jgi:hypothetical protein